jgi:hypothetical protein
VEIRHPTRASRFPSPERAATEWSAAAAASMIFPADQIGATADVNAPPGDSSFFCGVPGHEKAGMVGTMHIP